VPVWTHPDQRSYSCLLALILHYTGLMKSLNSKLEMALYKSDAQRFPTAEQHERYGQALNTLALVAELQAGDQAPRSLADRIRALRHEATRHLLIADRALGR
jgi:hypothetical protein